MVGDAGEDLAQVGFRIDAVELGAADQAVDAGSALAAGVGSGKQVALASEGDGAQRPLRGVVVCTLQGMIDPSVKVRLGQLSLRPEAQGAVQEATNGLKHFLKRPRRRSAGAAGRNVSEH